MGQSGEAWQRLFGHTRVLNLGFGWDRTQNVLWRPEHGDFDGLRPKTVIVSYAGGGRPAIASGTHETDVWRNGDGPQFSPAIPIADDSPPMVELAQGDVVPQITLNP
jgi:hypothetical protein